jgi:hypothetical protein
VIHGAQGLVYRDYRTVGGRGLSAYSLRRDAPQLWASMAETNGRVHELVPALLEGEPMAGAVITQQGLHVRLWHHPTGLYVAAANADSDFVEGTIGLPVRADTPVEVLGENRKLRTARAGLVDDFRPYEVHLYRVANAG